MDAWQFCILCLSRVKLSPQLHLNLKLFQVYQGLFFGDVFLLSILDIILTCPQGNNTYLEHFKVLYFLSFSDILHMTRYFCFILVISKDCLLKLTKYSLQHIYNLISYTSLFTFLKKTRKKLGFLPYMLIVTEIFLKYWQSLSLEEDMQLEKKVLLQVDFCLYPCLPP